jgi:hypothetical protein
VTTIAIAIVRRAITLERKISKKKQRTDTKKDAKLHRVTVLGLKKMLMSMAPSIP